MNQIKFGYKAEVFKCPLKFSPLKIEYPALQVGERDSHIIGIRNFSPKDYLCEFFLPYFEVCGFKMTPMFFQLKSGKSIEINLEYHSKMKKLGAFTLEELKKTYLEDPNKNFNARLRQIEEEKKAQEEPEEEKPKEVAPEPRRGRRKPEPKKAAQSKKKSKKEQEAEEEERKRQEKLARQREEEERLRKEKIEAEFDIDAALKELGGKFNEFDDGKKQSQHYKWLVPCFFRPVSEPETSRTAIYIEINTVTTSKILVSDRSEINFGEIAVGFRKIDELLITNKGDKTADLRMDLLPLFGGFYVLNALRSIPPGKTKNVVIQFEPHNQQEFKETLRIYCKESSISVKLRGRSVKPEVAIDPEDGILDVSACLPESKIEKYFTIKNVSNFGLEFRLDTLASGIKNSNGQEAFMYFPSEGKIQASEEQKIKVIFRPDRVSEKYWNLIKIDVPNQKKIQKIYVTGSCYARQAYVTKWNKLAVRPTVEELDKNVEMPLDFVRVSDSKNVIGYEVKDMVVQFEKEKEDVEKNSEDCYEKKIIVGSCHLSDAKLGKAVAYEIVIEVMKKQQKN